MGDRADEARLAGACNSVAELGVHAVRADHHVGVSRRSIAEAQMSDGAVHLHINEPFPELDGSGLHLFQNRRMQIVAMNGDVAGAVLLFPNFAERQLEQYLSGVPFAAGKRIRVDADPAQPIFGAEMAQYLHDIC